MARIKLLEIQAATAPVFRRLRAATAGNQDGQDLAEYALVLPVLLMLIFGIIEFGILVFDYNTVANAAREGARAGILSPSDACDLACLDARVTTAARRLTSGLDGTALAVSISRTADTVRVEVTYDAGLVAGPVIQALGGANTVRLRSVATMQRE